MLEVKNLEKSYGEVKALKGVSFSVESGKVFGLLGPNGAGKTTTFKIISTLLKPDRGDIFWEGKNIFESPKWWKREIGFVPQELAVYQELTGYENMMLMAGLYGLKGKSAKDRCLFLLDKIMLKDKMNHKVKTYSGGMKRRLNLIMGIVHNPDLILLDEPTAGIDVQTKLKIYEFIGELIKEGKTVLYTTHLLKEAEELFDIVGIIDEGELKAMGSVENLISRFAPSVLIDFELENFSGKENQLEKFGTLSKSGCLKVEVSSQNEVASIIEKLTALGVSVKAIKIKGASLETAFLNLTGKELRD